jgi:hypothetical protein
LVEATKEAIWMRGLYKELNFAKQTPVKIYCNNQSVIKISKNPIYHSKTKYFEIHLHYVCDMVKKQKIDVLYISTDKQPADILTKALGQLKFMEYKKLLNLTTVVKDKPND